MAGTRCCRCGLRRAADAACSVVRFQSVTTSARTGPGKLISARSPTAPILPAANATRPACDSKFRLIVRLLLQCGARVSDGVKGRLPEGGIQCTAAQPEINSG